MSDKKIILDALKAARPTFASMKGYPAHEAVLAKIDKAIKLAQSKLDDWI